MENKYYTPSIEEFHVGFECEWQSKIRNESWSKQICDVDLVNIAYDSIEHSDEEEPFNEQFRVKVLDQEDIESLGWENDKEVYGFKRLMFHKEITFRGEQKRVSILYVEQNNHLLVYINSKDMAAYMFENPEQKITTYGGTLFAGTIKNKSELKVLMKQLGIE